MKIIKQIITKKKEDLGFITLVIVQHEKYWRIAVYKIAWLKPKSHLAKQRG